MPDIRVKAKLTGGIINAKAEFGRMVEVPVGPDVYTGDYIVTAPSDGDLVLPTKDKLMEDDVTIEANHTLENALLQNTPLNEYRNDEVTEIRPYAFYQSDIKKIILPNVTYCNSYAFYGGSQNKGSVEEIYMPKLERNGSVVFARQTKLRIIDFGKSLGLDGRVGVCTSLNTIILRNTTSVVNVTQTTFADLPFAPDGTGGYVYVPQSLLEEYQANANWQNYANVLEFRPIEGSEYESEE